MNSNRNKYLRSTLGERFVIFGGPVVDGIPVQARREDSRFLVTWTGLCLNHTVQKDSREVLGTSFRFGPTSEILENIQYGGSSVVKTDSQRSRFIAREA